MLRRLLALALLLPSLASADYVTTILADSPCAFWKMNEASGTITNYGSANSGGGELNGTAHGGLTYAQTGGVTGYNSILFNGSTGYFDWSYGSGGTPGSCKSFGSGAGTAECWVSTSDSTSDAVLESESTPGTSRTFELDKGDSGKAVNFYIYNGSGYQGIVGTTNVPLNTWYHMAGTYSSTASGTVTVAYNGATENSMTGAGTPQASIGGYMGSHFAASVFFAGSIQMCAIYTTKLSDATLAAHVTAGTAAAGLPNMGRRIFQSRRTIIDPYFLPVSFGVREPDAFPLDVPTFIVDALNKGAIRSREVYAQ